jgi:hypothetical protein
VSSNTVGSSEAPRSAEGGFGYSGHSLEKLRLLASSIDTGRIVQMQLEFSHVSQHLNDVAAQLAAIRNELPNWWQGPAADSITAHFAPVIQRARDTESMASGAALALQHCAQVAGEQQEAMKRVPEVPDPNTAAPTVITPPGIPPGAELAAVAAQERAYSAARAEAAGHVNGIAAQYVETTAQLRGLTPNFDEGFQPITPARPHGVSFTPTISAAPPTAHAIPHPSAMHTFPPVAYHESGLRALDGGSLPEGWPPAVGLSPAEPWIPPTASVAFEKSQQRQASEDAIVSAAIPSLDTMPSIVTGRTGIGRSSLSKLDPLIMERPQSHPPLDPLITEGSQAHTSPMAEPYLHYDESGRARFGSTSGAIEPATSERQQLCGAPSAAGTHASPEKGERGRRPSYLKESKSVWLPDASAAPHGGVLTPNWADQ